MSICWCCTHQNQNELVILFHMLFSFIFSSSAVWNKHESMSVLFNCLPYVNYWWRTMKLFSPLKFIQNKIFVSGSRQNCFIVILKKCCLKKKNAIHLTSSLQSLKQRDVFIRAIFQFLCSNVMPLDNIVALITFPHLSVCPEGEYVALYNGLVDCACVVCGIKTN